MSTWPWQLHESMDNWYALVNARFGDVADSSVEGAAEEWRAIATALRNRENVSFKRCRVWWERGVEFCLDSPRNTMGRPARLSGHAKANELADIIEAALKSKEADVLDSSAPNEEEWRAALAEALAGWEHGELYAISDGCPDPVDPRIAELRARFKIAPPD